jgi:hypothetical protein
MLNSQALSYLDQMIKSGVIGADVHQLLPVGITLLAFGVMTALFFWERLYSIQFRSHSLSAIALGCCAITIAQFQGCAGSGGQPQSGYVDSGKNYALIVGPAGEKVSFTLPAGTETDSVVSYFGSFRSVTLEEGANGQLEACKFLAPHRALYDVSRLRFEASESGLVVTAPLDGEGCLRLDFRNSQELLSVTVPVMNQATVVAQELQARIDQRLADHFRSTGNTHLVLRKRDLPLQSVINDLKNRHPQLFAGFDSASLELTEAEGNLFKLNGITFGLGNDSGEAMQSWFQSSSLWKPMAKSYIPNASQTAAAEKEMADYTDLGSASQSSPLFRDITDQVEIFGATKVENWVGLSLNELRMQSLLHWYTSAVSHPRYLPNSGLSDAELSEVPAIYETPMDLLTGYLRMQDMMEDAGHPKWGKGVLFSSACPSDPALRNGDCNYVERMAGTSGDLFENYKSFLKVGFAKGLATSTVIFQGQPIEEYKELQIIQGGTPRTMNEFSVERNDSRIAEVRSASERNVFRPIAAFPSISEANAQLDSIRQAWEELAGEPDSQGFYSSVDFVNKWQALVEDYGTDFSDRSLLPALAGTGGSIVQAWYNDLCRRAYDEEDCGRVLGSGIPYKIFPTDKKHPWMRDFNRIAFVRADAGGGARLYVNVQSSTTISMRTNSADDSVCTSGEVTANAQFSSSPFSWLLAVSLKNEDPTFFNPAAGWAIELSRLKNTIDTSRFFRVHWQNLLSHLHFHKDPGFFGYRLKRDSADSLSLTDLNSRVTFGSGGQTGSLETFDIENELSSALAVADNQSVYLNRDKAYVRTRSPDLIFGDQQEQVCSFSSLNPEPNYNDPHGHVQVWAPGTTYVACGWEFVERESVNYGRADACPDGYAGGAGSSGDFCGQSPGDCRPVTIFDCERVSSQKLDNEKISLSLWNHQVQDWEFINRHYRRTQFSCSCNYQQDLEPSPWACSMVGIERPGATASGLTDYRSEAFERVVPEVRIPPSAETCPSIAQGNFSHGTHQALVAATGSCSLRCQDQPAGLTRNLPENLQRYLGHNPANDPRYRMPSSQVIRDLRDQQMSALNVSVDLQTKRYLELVAGFYSSNPYNDGQSIRSWYSLSLLSQGRGSAPSGTHGNVNTSSSTSWYGTVSPLLGNFPDPTSIDHVQSLTGPVWWAHNSWYSSSPGSWSHWHGSKYTFADVQNTLMGFEKGFPTATVDDGNLLYSRWSLAEAYAYPQLSVASKHRWKVNRSVQQNQVNNGNPQRSFQHRILKNDQVVSTGQNVDGILGDWMERTTLDPVNFGSRYWKAEIPARPYSSISKAVLATWPNTALEALDFSQKTTIESNSVKLSPGSVCPSVYQFGTSLPDPFLGAVAFLGPEASSGGGGGGNDDGDGDGDGFGGGGGSGGGLGGGDDDGGPGGGGGSGGGPGGSDPTDPNECDPQNPPAGSMVVGGACVECTFLSLSGGGCGCDPNRGDPPTDGGPSNCPPGAACSLSGKCCEPGTPGCDPDQNGPPFVEPVDPVTRPR